MSVEVIPSGKPVGAEIKGVDIAAGIDEGTFKKIRDAFLTHSVVFMRGQHLSIPQQRDFCGRFGPSEEHATQYTVPGYRDVLCISNILDEKGKPIGIIDAGQVWHTDGHFEARPTLYSMLYSVEVPRAADGRALGPTRFASTTYAYDILPDVLKKRVDGLTAENTMRQVIKYFHSKGLAKKRAPLTEAQERLLAVHPVIRTHPYTGRKCVYVTSAHTERVREMSEDESRNLIDELQGYCLHDDAIYQHDWEEGDLLMWDNCATQHCAIGDYNEKQRRLMYRVSVQGLPTT